MAHCWPVIQQVDPLHVKHEGKAFVYFGGCDYLRLSWHPAVRRAVTQGMKQHGLNVAASRGTTGNHPLYGLLERSLANFFGVQDAIIVSNGYMAPLIVGQASAGLFDEVIMDSKAHACLRDAAPFITHQMREFPHGAPPSVASLRNLTTAGSRALIMTDGLFSQNGHVAPLREWSTTLRRKDWLLVDDAHGVGVMGTQGQGTLEWTGTKHPRILLTATLSKAFGVYGGMILGNSRMLNRIRERSRMLVGNTPLPLPLVEAALVSVSLMQKSHQRRNRLRTRTSYLKDMLRKEGWKDPVSSPAPIVFGTPRSPMAAERVSKALTKAGVYPSHIHYPGASRGGYFRFAVSSEHSREQLKILARVLLEQRGAFEEQT